MDIINKNVIKEIKNELIDNEIPCYVYDLNEICQTILIYIMQSRLILIMKS